MPKAGHNYEEARLLRAKGMNYKDISEQTAIPVTALARYAQRHNWDQKHNEIVASVSANVASRHVHEVTRLCHDRLEELRSFDFASALAKCGASEYISLIDRLDTIVRRALCMELQANSAPGVALQLNVTGNATVHADSLADDTSKNAAHVVDVQQISDEQPATQSRDAAAS